MDTGIHRSHGDRIQPREVKKPSVWNFYDRFDLTAEESDALRPRPTDFTHVKLDRSVIADSYLQRLKGRSGRHNDRVAQERGPRKGLEDVPSGNVFEEFLVQTVRDARWFDGEVFRTSEHDDWWNGVDAVIEWPNPTGEGAPVRLAVDFSISENQVTIGDKLASTNGLAKLKYFRSPTELNEEGKPLEARIFFPKVVLGADIAMFKEIAKSGAMPGHEHPLRTIMLKQVKRQIDVQIRRGADYYLNQAWQEDSPHPSVDDLCKRIRVAKNLDEIAVAMGDAPDDAFKKLFDTDGRNRLKQLLLIKRCIDPVVKEAAETPLDDTWKNLADVSLNNRLLTK
ncbi:MAG: hypothetical protein NUV56_04180 [Candidatus Uhrbacteria bacterium]|nr:hypothetical protein [Candidatus Uhrbacteria bacterium]